MLQYYCEFVTAIVLI